MKKIILLPLLFSAFCLSAFEVYGLKGGMTKTEFYELTACQAFVDQYNKDNPPGKRETLKDISFCEYGIGYYSVGSVKKVPLFRNVKPSIYLQWTHDDKLWRVSVKHTKPEKVGILQGIAFERAVRESHPGMEIVESSYNSQYVNLDYLTVNYIDDALSDMSIKHYMNQYLEAHTF